MPELAEKSSCTGCSACAEACPKNCIQMLPDQEGFLHPVVDKTACVKCGVCEKVCPVLHPLAIPLSGTQAYGAISTDEPIRMQSTSGGVFTLLADFVLSRGGTVFGAAYGSYFSVEHIAVSNYQDLQKLRTAKYAQSCLGDTFQQAKALLRSGNYVLFSGTPCQIAGLQSYLQKPYDNLILVDVICHGVPSPKVWQTYLQYRNQKDAPESRISAVNLRSKETGWPEYSIRFEYEDGTVYSAKNKEDPFLRGFVGDFYLRESCYKCPFKGIERCSDFTLADFWGIDNLLPEMNDRKGTSLVFVHSEKGREIWTQLQNRLLIQQVDPMKSVAHNGSALTSSHRPSKRTQFWNCYEKEDFMGLVTELLLPPPPPSFLHRALGKLKRLAAGILHHTFR